VDVPASWDRTVAVPLERPVHVLAGRRRGFLVVGTMHRAVASSTHYPREMVAADEAVMLMAGRGFAGPVLWGPEKERSPSVRAKTSNRGIREGVS
jgi:hypothetical protein